MILEIVKYGNPVLREKGREVKTVDDKIKQLATDMLETMRDANGVGLAAQQIGVPIQLTVIDVAGIEDRPSAMWIGDKEVPLEEYMSNGFMGRPSASPCPTTARTGAIRARPIFPRRART